MSSSTNPALPHPDPDPPLPAGAPQLTGDALIDAVAAGTADPSTGQSLGGLSTGEPAGTTEAHRHSIDPQGALKKLGFGRFSLRMRRWRRLLAQINELEPTLLKEPDASLKKRSLALR